MIRMFIRRARKIRADARRCDHAVLVTEDRKKRALLTRNLSLDHQLFQRFMPDGCQDAVALAAGAQCDCTRYFIIINDKLCYGIVNFLLFARNAADFHTPDAEFVLACDRPKRSFGAARCAVFPIQS